MRVIENTDGFREEYGACVATIGKFDGVHTGHQLILQQLRGKAAELGLPAVVILIEPHPEEFFAASPRNCPARLSELEEKLELLQAQGVDIVYKLRFDAALQGLSAQAYIENILIDGLGIAALIIGNDFRFGNQRLGDFALLESYAGREGFELIESASCEHEGVRISSTYVRQQLQAGNFDLVELLLNRPYAISGTVVQGQQLGRDLGFPTCNVKLNRKCLPLHGVYACEVQVDNADMAQRLLKGAANIGYRPTVSDELRPVLEVHLLDFDSDIYGERITVIFRKKIREERKFENLQALQTCIAIDVQTVRDYFAKDMPL
ncbi:MAG: bifunctional riboflavin kinase/FAD synthetase [Pseudomonadales bacterium]|nr:bifunctional riboflavin kinase/FAD synthetase [Pseudomonadales bacterium]MCP5329929.1 bifunctional riboflavin kinase/FAD synthetase [Pseudomonadales bacterium]MCP5343192.1 bifunctional riboflavin kinase/FAD synthetase [Pseudomonadales bacterium]